MSLLINKTLEICLKVTGLWPYNVNYIGSVVLLSTLVTTLPFQCWNALSLKDNPTLLMDSLSDIFSEILIFIKLFAMWISKSDIKDLLREIIDDWNRKSISDEWKILARYCRIFCSFDIALYLSAILFYYLELISIYVKKPAEFRLLLFKSYYPFDYQSTPNYELLNGMQIIQGYSMVIVDTLSKTLLVAYILHVVARIHLLEDYIKEYSDNCKNLYEAKDPKSCTNLKLIIHEHLKILTLVQKIDTAYSYISLFQLLFSNILICVTGFVIITAMESSNTILMIKFITFILAMLSQAFTFCAAGQFLRNKGELVVHMIYNCFWYNAKPEEIRTIMFIISNAQHPLRLTGGGVIELSINSFTQILKTSASYLSVLRAVYT